MFWLNIGIIILAAIVVSIYVREKVKAYTVKSVLIKTFASFLFIAVALVSAYHNGGHIINPFIILGLLFGLSGDIWLDLKYVYPKEDKIFSYAGFIVFGIGHIFFITGMYLEFFNNAHILYAILPFIGSVVVSLINLLLAKPLKIYFKDMTAISLIYSIMLFSLPLCSLSLCILYSFSNITLNMLFAAGIIFAVSDLVLSKTYFSEGHEKLFDFILNYLFYYSAQFLIAFSIFFL